MSEDMRKGKRERERKSPRGEQTHNYMSCASMLGNAHAQFPNPKAYSTANPQAMIRDSPSLRNERHTEPNNLNHYWNPIPLPPHQTLVAALELRKFGEYDQTTRFLKALWGSWLFSLMVSGLLGSDLRRGSCLFLVLRGWRLSVLGCAWRLEAC